MMRLLQVCDLAYFLYASPHIRGKAFQLGRLAELPLAAVAVEGRYSALLAYKHAPAGWLADQLVRLQARYAQVPVLFLDSRRHAEDWTHRFLATALADSESITTHRAS